MKQKKISLAILFTCFNRKEKTLRCIESLKNQKNIPDFDLYICDDCSTDGTKTIIKQHYPETMVMDGTGSLFWCRGMYMVMEAAVKKNYDFYLMINDDVEFFPSMYRTMMEAYEFGFSGCGIVGSTKSAVTGNMTYGGNEFIRTKSNYRMGEKIPPDNSQFQKAGVANWNCFLIDRTIINKVGLIDNFYAHSLGDYDYSLEMRRKGYPIYIAKDYVGYCEHNSRKNTYLDGKLSRKNRLIKMVAPNGFPIKSWIYFINKNYDKYQIKNMLIPYLKNLIAILLGKDIT